MFSSSRLVHRDANTEMLVVSIFLSRTWLYISCVLILVISLFVSVPVEAQRDGARARNANVFVEDNATRIDLEIPPDLLYRDTSIYLCGCSPTSRGHPPLDDKLVVDFIAALKVVQNTPFSNLLRSAKERLAEYAARDLRDVYSEEGLVNLDATLRDNDSIVLCIYLNDTSKVPAAEKNSADLNIGKNLGLWRVTEIDAPNQYVTLKPCDQVNRTRASDEILEKFVNQNPTDTNVKKEL